MRSESNRRWMTRPASGIWERSWVALTRPGWWQGMVCMTIGLIVLSALAICPSPLNANDLLVASGDGDGPPPATWLELALKEQAIRTIQSRQTRYEAVRSQADAEAYQKRLRTVMTERLGEFPERTPLDAEVVGRLAGERHRVEKVIFSSQPGHRVTGLMYLPMTPPPYPCVIVSSGHSRTAKTAEYNQRFGIIMARHGMAAFCFDPIGQGERSQVLNAQRQPAHAGTTTEHFLMGIGSILVGRNTATYRIWDAMRAIDYVTSRSDIRADRIGFTGCSGGGTLTSYLMALDQRVRCAAPSCYLTTFRRLLETIGPQDAEQNLFGQLAGGLDQTDYVLLHAPQPTLISATTDDFFDISGTWDNFRQAKQFYHRFGHAERIDLVEGDGGHGVPFNNLVAITRWMRRWLLEVDDAIEETEFALHPPEALRCTPTGQVLDLPQERSVFDLNVTLAKSWESARREFEQASSPAELREQVQTLAAIAQPQSLPAVTAQSLGTVERESVRIEKLLLRRTNGIPLPALLMTPRLAAAPSDPAQTPRDFLYLDGNGKGVAAEPQNVCLQLVKQGHRVLAVDLPGMGETRPKGTTALLGDWKNFYLAYLMGKSLVGIRAEAALQAASWWREATKNAPGGEPVPARSRELAWIARGEAVIPALHAVTVGQVATPLYLPDGQPSSWAEVLNQPEAENQLVGTVHHALRFYDLPDLVRWHGHVILSWPKDGQQ